MIIRIHLPLIILSLFSFTVKASGAAPSESGITAEKTELEDPYGTWRFPAIDQPDLDRPAYEDPTANLDGIAATLLQIKSDYPLHLRELMKIFQSQGNIILVDSILVDSIFGKHPLISSLLSHRAASYNADYKTISLKTVALKIVSEALNLPEEGVIIEISDPKEYVGKRLKALLGISDLNLKSDYWCTQKYLSQFFKVSNGRVFCF